VKQQYKEYIKLNKNILLGFTASIVISAIVAHLFSGQAHYLNATITLAVYYVVYFSTFGDLFYFDNRKKYVAYLASLVSQSIPTAIYMVVVNLGVKFMRLYKNAP
jgi:hypothetical protein